MIAGIMSPSAIYAGGSAEEPASVQTGTSEADQTENEDTRTAGTDVPGDAGLSSGNENSQSAADITGSDNTVISASDSANDAEELPGNPIQPQDQKDDQTETDQQADVSTSPQTDESASSSEEEKREDNTEDISDIYIEYDEKENIHYLNSPDGSKIILYCMNNNSQWPHIISGVVDKLPVYHKESLEEFYKNNVTIPDDQTKFINAITNLLYIGYPYNGLGLYQSTETPGTITEDQFNAFLNPPQYLRKDFPDYIGNYIFKYSDGKITAKELNDKGEYVNVKEDEVKQHLSDFMTEVMQLGTKTSSGRTQSDIVSEPFYKAVYSINSSDPLQVYVKLFVDGNSVTNEQAYNETSKAVWKLMYENAVFDTEDLIIDGLSKKMLDTAKGSENIEPQDSDFGIKGEQIFSYDEEEKNWHTGELTLSTPDGNNSYFKLVLPEGITEKNGRIQIRGGDSFELVTYKKPESNTSLSLTADIPYMVGEPIVYYTDEVDLNGKKFQNMVGAEIKKKKITVSASIQLAESTPTTTPETTPGTTPETTPSTTPETTPSTTPVTTPSTTPAATVVPTIMPGGSNSNNTGNTNNTANTNNTQTSTNNSSNVSTGKPLIRKVMTGRVSTGDNTNNRIWQVSVMISSALLVVFVIMVVRNRKKRE